MVSDLRLRGRVSDSVNPAAVERRRPLIYNAFPTDACLEHSCKFQIVLDLPLF